MRVRATRLGVTGCNARKRGVNIATVFGADLVTYYEPTVQDLWVKHQTEVAAGRLPLLYQDSDGVLPMTALDQTAGLLVDSSRGAAVSATEIATRFYDPSAWTLTNATLTLRPDGALRLTVVAAGAEARAVLETNSVTISLNQTHLQVTARSDATATLYRTGYFVSGGNFAGSIRTGHVTAIPSQETSRVRPTVPLIGRASDILQQDVRVFKNVSTNTDAGQWIEFKMSQRDIPGVHLTQSVPTKRPVLTARVNRVPSTENLGGWPSNVTLGVTDNVADPWGGTSAKTLLANGPNSRLGFATGLTLRMVQRFWIRRRSGTGAVNYFDGSGYFPLADLSGAWQEFVLPTSATSSNNYFIIQLVTSGDSVDIARPDLRDIGFSGLPPFQRITSASNYDTAGFPAYLSTDGVDDALTTLAVNLSAASSAEVFCAAHRTAGTGRATVVDFNNPITNVNGFAVEFSTDDAAVDVGARFRAGGVGQVAARPLGIGTAALLHGRWAGLDQLARFRTHSATENVSAGTTGNSGGMGTGVLTVGSRGNGLAPIAGAVWALPLLVKRACTDGEIKAVKAAMNKYLGGV